MERTGEVGGGGGGRGGGQRRSKDREELKWSLKILHCNAVTACS